MAWLNFARPFLSAVIILPFVVLFQPKVLKPTKKDLFDYAVIGLLLAFAIYGFNSAVLLAPVAVVMFVGGISPLLVFVLSYLFLSEKATWQELLAAIIVLIGLAIMNPFEPTISAGFFMALLSFLFYSAVIVYIRKEEKGHGVGMVFWFLLFASVFLFPFALLSEPSNSHYSWGVMACVGLLNALAYVLQCFALRYINADAYAVINNIIGPLTALLFGTVFLSQVLLPNQLIGGAVILSSLYFLRKDFSA